jgi:hypothetical protein
MKSIPFKAVLILSAAATACTQQPQQSNDPQDTSSFRYSEDDPSKTIEIQNVTYEAMGPGIPGRPKDEMLVLRKKTATKQVVDEVGAEANTTVEAWPLGTDFNDKPVYSIMTSGVNPVTLHGEIVVVSRGLEDVEWWSVYKIGTGERLFDTYAPVARSSISREIRTMRYIGLEVPPDDATDARLKAANVVAVLTYASGDRVLREALVTNDDTKAAQVMRSYFDATRTVDFDGKRIRITIRENYPSTAKAVTIDVPVTNDDLDLPRSLTPAGIHLTAWNR